MPVVEHLFDSRDAMLVELENYVINSLITAFTGQQRCEFISIWRFNSGPFVP